MTADPRSNSARRPRVYGPKICFTEFAGTYEHATHAGALRALHVSGDIISDHNNLSG
jgi:hypothetical protein